MHWFLYHLHSAQKPDNSGKKGTEMQNGVYLDGWHGAGAHVCQDQQDFCENSIYRKMQFYFTKSIDILQLLLGSNFAQTAALKFQHSWNIFLLFV